MKTKTLITLSICLLLFACGEKKPPEKKVKQKSVTKIAEKPKQETKKEKVLAALPAKKDEHVHGPNCGHEHAASSEHVNMMAKSQEERMKLAEMLPEEIREKIAKMVADREVKELARMCYRLSQIDDFDNAFLIASNFLAHAETETEKQMAASFYANLVADAFSKQNTVLNDENRAEYENVVNLLEESLKNTPDDINIEQILILNDSLFCLPKLLIKYNFDVDSAYKNFDSFVYKAHKDPQKIINNYLVSMTCYQLELPENYKKMKLNNENLERLIKDIDQISASDPENSYQLWKNNAQRYKEYVQKKKTK